MLAVAFTRWWITRRRAVTAGLLAFAVVVGLSAIVGRHQPTTRVVVAAHDIAAGAALTEGDVRIAEIASDLVPSTSVSSVGDLIGRVATGPIAAHEVITTTRVVSSDASAGVAIPIRLADRTTASLLRPGDRIDVYASASGDGQIRPAQLVASAVRVITVPATSRDSDGGLIVVSGDDDNAALLAGAVDGPPLTVVIRPN